MRLNRQGSLKVDRGASARSRRLPMGNTGSWLRQERRLGCATGAYYSTRCYVSVKIPSAGPPGNSRNWALCRHARLSLLGESWLAPSVYHNIWLPTVVRPVWGWFHLFPNFAKSWTVVLLYHLNHVVLFLGPGWGAHC